MAEQSRPVLRRWLVGAGLLMVVAAIAVFAGVPLPGGDDGDTGPVPEAGSRFRDRAPTDGDRTTVLEALAPVLGQARRRPTGPGSLSDARAVAQLVAVGAAAPGPATEREWGAVLARGDEATVRRLRRAIRRRARGGRRVPPLLAVEPAAVGAQPDLGDLGLAEIRSTFARAGRAAAADGVDLVLAPSADLRVSGLPGELRSFGDDPAKVAAQVDAAAAGWTEGGVLPVPGRFPGEGAASQDPLEGAATVGLGPDELLSRDVQPFAAVAADVPAVQLSSALYAAFDGVTPASLLPDTVRLLRGRLGFRGVVVSADLVAATAATGGTVGQAAVDAVRAGCDLLLISGGQAEQRDAVRAVLSAMRGGAISRPQIDRSVRRVLALKRRAGLDLRAASRPARARRG